MISVHFHGWRDNEQIIADDEKNKKKKPKKEEKKDDDDKILEGNLSLIS
jgi:hypothetical protein